MCNKTLLLLVCTVIIISCSGTVSSGSGLFGEIEEMEYIESVHVISSDTIRPYTAGNHYDLAEVRDRHLFLTEREQGNETVVRSINLELALEIEINHSINRVRIYF